MGTGREPRVGPRNHVWLVVAAVLVVLGTVGSIFGSEGLDRSESQRSRQAFVTSSMGIASTLGLTIQHEQDLVTATGAVIVDQPGHVPGRFREVDQ